MFFWYSPLSFVHLCRKNSIKYLKAIQLIKTETLFYVTSVWDSGSNQNTPAIYLFIRIYFFFNLRGENPPKIRLAWKCHWIWEQRQRDVRRLSRAGAAELPAVSAGSHSAHAAHHLHSSHVYLEKGWALLILQSSFWFGATSLLAAFQHYTSHSDTR